MEATDRDLSTADGAENRACEYMTATIASEGEGEGEGERGRERVHGALIGELL